MSERDEFMTRFRGVPAYQIARVMFLLAPALDMRKCSKGHMADAWAARNDADGTYGRLLKGVTIERIEGALNRTYQVRRKNIVR